MVFVFFVAYPQNSFVMKPLVHLTACVSAVTGMTLSEGSKPSCCAHGLAWDRICFGWGKSSGSAFVWQSVLSSGALEALVGVYVVKLIVMAVATVMLMLLD